MKRLPTNSFINLDELNFDYSFCDKKQRELVMAFVKTRLRPLKKSQTSINGQTTGKKFSKATARRHPSLKRSKTS